MSEDSLIFYCLLAEYFSYEQSMMQGPAMITHSQPIPPPHHHGHNFPPSNILANLPSAHMIAPLHQIHPQQVFLVILLETAAIKLYKMNRW